MIVIITFWQNISIHQTFPRQTRQTFLQPNFPARWHYLFALTCCSVVATWLHKGREVSPILYICALKGEYVYSAGAGWLLLKIVCSLGLSGPNCKSLACCCCLYFQINTTIQP